jgi:hypothetical protein
MTHPHAELIGKHILVGLTYLDHNGDVARQLQLHGLISCVGDHTLQFERADGKGDFSIPFDGVLPAGQPDAVYTLRATGEQVTGVDYVVSWTIHPNPDGA